MLLINEFDRTAIDPSVISEVISRLEINSQLHNDQIVWAQRRRSCNYICRQTQSAIRIGTMWEGPWERAISKNVCVYVCMYVCMCVYVCVCVYVCMYVCMCVCICMCVYVCMYVCMYVCACVCLYVCMCVNASLSTIIWNGCMIGRMVLTSIYSIPT